jgi:hypothetical protein
LVKKKNQMQWRIDSLKWEKNWENNVEYRSLNHKSKIIFKSKRNWEKLIDGSDVKIKKNWEKKICDDPFSRNNGI